MLTAPDFINVLAGLIESLPMQKVLSERGLAFAWSTFPQEAKDQLSPRFFAFAATQRLLDPEPRQHLAIHIQLLAYLYPLSNGIPIVQQGLRSDLSDRLLRPGVFHPLTIYPPHLRALPEVADVRSMEESPEQRLHRLHRLAAQFGVAQ